MKAIIRWLTIAVSFVLASMLAATVSGAPGGARRSPSDRASGATSHSRSSRASLRTVRYSREAGSSRPKSTKQKKTRKRRRYRSRRVHLPKAPSQTRISEIQSALARSGYYDADPNGKWDAKTVAAVKKFQSENNLDPTGKLDAPTLQKLGLGSDIAGVSAPKPIVPARCCDESTASDPPAHSAPSTQAPGVSSASPGHSSTSLPKPSPTSSSSSGAGSTSRSTAATAAPPR